MAYQLAPIVPMTLNDVEGRSPSGSFQVAFFEQLFSF